MKVICPGFPKTGTKSFRKALEILGFKNVHDAFEQLVYDHDVIVKWKRGEASIADFRKAYGNVDACIEFPASLMYKEMLEAFPDALVVLTVRPIEEWLKSVKHAVDVEQRLSIWLRYPKISKLLFQNRFCPNASKVSEQREFVYKEGYGLSLYNLNSIKDDDFKRGVRHYTMHNKEVIRLCKNRKLLIFNVSEGWEPLCKFLGKEIPDEPFPMRNVKHAVFRDAARTNQFEFDGGLTKTVVNELTRMVATVMLGVLSLCVGIYAAIL